jgi:hypothetical protein
MTIAIIVVAVLVIGYLLYLGTNRRRVQQEEERDQLQGKAEDHRVMASRHEQQAEELEQAAEEV